MVAMRGLPPCILAMRLGPIWPVSNALNRNGTSARAWAAASAGLVAFA